MLIVLDLQLSLNPWQIDFRRLELQISSTNYRILRISIFRRYLSILILYNRLVIKVASLIKKKDMQLILAKSQTTFLLASQVADRLLIVSKGKHTLTHHEAD